MKTPQEWIASKTRLANKLVITDRFTEKDIKAIQDDAYNQGMRDASLDTQTIRTTLEYFLERGKRRMDQSDIDRCEEALNPQNKKGQA